MIEPDDRRHPADAPALDPHTTDLVIDVVSARGDRRLLKSFQDLSRRGVAVIWTENRKEYVVEEQIGDQRLHIVARQHLNRCASPPLLFVTLHQGSGSSRIGQEEVTPLAERRTWRVAKGGHAPVEAPPQLHAVLHHLHGHWRTELLPNTSHGEERRGASIGRVALHDHNAACKAVLTKVPGRARAHHRAADDHDVCRITHSLTATCLANATPPDTSPSKRRARAAGRRRKRRTQSRRAARIDQRGWLRS